MSPSSPPDDVLREHAAALRAVGATDLAQAADRLTPDDLARVARDAGRLLDDDGVTYARPGEAPGPWRLDPLPLVLGSAQWAGLERGLVQRAELLEAVLADLHGPQRLLAEGVVPPEAVLRHPGFLRALTRASSADPRPLELTATDVARDEEGRWLVLGDRTQAPSGLGYALENRRVLSRVLPELYREASLHRVGPFFGALRTVLLQCADEEVADPQVVVLTPGSHSETAYDQAVVATRLGFPLVRGEDLVVRRGRLWLRSLDRLEPVHVVLRRVDPAWCDPLELRPDSRLGVPGLLECVRRGTVRVVNALGATVLENPALLPFLPAAASLLLGEPLRLPSVPTWWCGAPAGLERARALLGAGRDASGGSVGEVLVRALDRSTPLAGDDRLARVEADPGRYVVQHRPPLATTATLVEDGLAARPVTLRTFALRQGASYRLLLGGLAAVQPGPGGPPERAGGPPTKDVWVLKAEPSDRDQGLGASLPALGHRVLTPSVPRALEHLFWLGRYAERAETLLRLVLATHPLVEDFAGRRDPAGPGTSGGRAVEVLVGALARFAGPPQRLGDVDGYLHDLLTDRGRPGSAAQSLDAARVAAEGVRDQLSADTWRALAVADRAEAELVRTLGSHHLAEGAGRMLTGVLALHGVTGNMVRDPGWHLLEAGRALERGLQLALLLRVVVERHGIEVDRTVLQTVLAAAESSVTHRRRHRGDVRPATVLDLLLTDPDNPRSLAFSLGLVGEHLAAVPTATGATRPERLLADLREEVAELDVATLVAIGGASRPHLERHLTRLTDDLTRVADAVAATHLAAGPAPRAFGGGREPAVRGLR
ncbi:circularly permuted type 2 ATP-grasp protein [Lapillicoccus jejuensis]|uniref:Putative circularly permuted ATP-grasp superfamily protein n=1 Tax=Lapillicoccus jejuensis TaxID=402171 RepID=A0A542DYT8_9MICO|nr:circularly permuted type 2 ATP-grasp protein [Lapillicoccus jejuensis]TQJ08263.1 putative circularly permuted ATP-grasp superfamily protein [Lapillicoccus jejuensis]